MRDKILKALIECFDEDRIDERPEYCPDNTGDALLSRVRSKVPECPHWFTGDRRILRKMYSALFDLYRLEGIREGGRSQRIIG